MPEVFDANVLVEERVYLPHPAHVAPGKYKDDKYNKEKGC